MSEKKGGGGQGQVEQTFTFPPFSQSTPISTLLSNRPGASLSFPFSLPAPSWPVHWPFPGASLHWTLTSPESLLLVDSPSEGLVLRKGHLQTSHQSHFLLDLFGPPCFRFCIIDTVSLAGLQKMWSVSSVMRVWALVVNCLGSNPCSATY